METQTPPKTISESSESEPSSEPADLPETESFSEAESDAFFFRDISEEKRYDVRHSFFTEDIPSELRLKIEKVSRFERGTLYKLGCDYEKEFSGRYTYGSDRLSLGYFYVMDNSGTIYRIWDNDMTEDVLNSEDNIISTGTVVCQEDEKAETVSEAGLCERITVKGDQREYYGYNSLTETGFYECFIWELGQGLVYYTSGFGAEEEMLELTAKKTSEKDWRQDHIDNFNRDYKREEVPESDDSSSADDLDRQYNEDMEKTNGITSEMIKVISDYSILWKSKMEQSYQMLMERFDENGKTMLENEQGIWNAYSQQNTQLKLYCNASGYDGGGTYLTVLEAELEYQRYRDRALELMDLYSIVEESALPDSDEPSLETNEPADVTPADTNVVMD